MHDNDTLQHAPADGGAAFSARADLRSGDQPAKLPVVFTGSGSEYFRIWIVNLLLSIVTLSLYRPYAKARRLAYFHGNTLVGGQPLGFHGDPRRMLRGYLLMLLFGAAYFGASQFSPVAALVALVAFVLLWPALWRASLQFRLANTSWCGVRMGFTGDLAGAYKAMLPGALPWLLFVGVVVLFAPAEGADPATPAAPSATFFWLFGLSFTAMLVLVPLSLAWIKRYQHGHYVYAGQRSQLDAGAVDFYAYCVKLFGVSLAVGLASALLAVGVGALVLGSGAFSEDTGLMAPAAGAAIAMLVLYGSFFLVTLPYAQSRLQNLVWGHTRSQSVRFASTLKLLPLGGLTVKNLLLVIVTLGLYWPFAAVAVARLRLQSVSVEIDGDIAQWQAGAVAGQHDATGDAAGDFFGIDMGL